MMSLVDAPISPSPASSKPAQGYLGGCGAIAGNHPGGAWARLAGIYNAKLPLNPTLYTRVDEWIYSFHMPLFLVLAGLFMARAAAKPAGNFFADKLGTIVYPYALWTLLQGAVAIAIGRFHQC